MKNTIDLESGLCRLELSGTDGRVLEFSFAGEVLAQEGRQLFSLGFRDMSGESIVLSSNDFRKISSETVPGGLVLHYAAHPENDDIAATVFIRPMGNSFRFHISVSGQDRRMLLDWFDCPEIIVDGHLRGRGGESLLFMPLYEGMIVSDPEAHPYIPIDFPNPGCNGYYPGNAQMQFLAYYTGRAGLYFAAHDRTDGTKAVDFEYLPEDEEIRLTLQTFCGGGETGAYSAPFEIVLAGFNGDWMDAAEIYRSWAVTDHHLPQRLAEEISLPAWFDESPVTLFVPVRGNGDDKGEMAPNEYFPYSNIMKAARSWSDEFSCPVMTMLMHWEGTAPWAPPYVWPPYGGESALAELRDALHAEGHLLGVYCSGTAWTQTSSITDYSREEQFREENLRAEMCRGARGEINAAICNGPKGEGQRMGFECCVGQEWTRRTIAEEMRKLAEFGIDYCQTFDQNMGGTENICYSRKHQHPPIPGAWQTEAMIGLCRDVRREIRDAGSRMIFGCEAGAAQPYLKYMRFNDSRCTCAFLYRSVPVPAYAYVFHEYLNNFQGNQVCADMVLDKKTPENLLFRTAFSFISGDMLSLVLRNNCEAGWGWVSKWDEPAPDQESLKKLIGNLNYWRRREGKPYLVYGRMRKPLVNLNGVEEFHLAAVNPEWPEFDVDALLTSAWQAPDGTEVQFIVNYLPRPQKIRLEPPAGDTISIRRMNGTSFGGCAGMEVVVPPLEALMVSINDD